MEGARRVLRQERHGLGIRFEQFGIQPQHDRNAEGEPSGELFRGRFAQLAKHVFGQRERDGRRFNGAEIDLDHVFTSPGQTSCARDGRGVKLI